jgi:hypothetical protein
MKCFFCCIKFYPNFRRDFFKEELFETKKISSKRKKRQQQQARRESEKNKGEIREILDDDFRDIFDLKIHDRQTPIFTTLEGTENIFIARALCD